jgi:hypothetical protein
MCSLATCGAESEVCRAAVIVDGVQCSVDLKSRVVTIGSGLVGHNERDRFKFPVAVPLEPYELLEARVSERARKRPKLAALAARAALADSVPVQVVIPNDDAGRCYLPRTMEP